MDKNTFWIVVNFDSAHWPMNEAKICHLFEDAEKYAKGLAAKYRGKSYHILQAVALVRQPLPETETISLTQIALKDTQNPGQSADKAADNLRAGLGHAAP